MQTAKGIALYLIPAAIKLSDCNRELTAALGRTVVWLKRCHEDEAKKDLIKHPEIYKILALR
jgi:hypothetical protein